MNITNAITTAIIITIILGISLEKIDTYKENKQDKNLIIINIDSLREDYINTTNSPNLQKLKENNIYFTNAYAHSSWTRTSTASLISGLNVETHGIKNESQESTLKQKIYTIQDYYNEKGYDTATFYNNPHMVYGIDQNFKYKQYENTKNLSETINEKITNWIKTRQTKYFIYTHINDLHTNYEYRKETSTKPKNETLRNYNKVILNTTHNIQGTCDNYEYGNLTEKDKQTLKELYIENIKYIDKHLGKLIKNLEQEKNLIIIITSDHGELFGEQNEYWHGCSLKNELIKIPIIMIIPNEKKIIITHNTAQIDIFPTIIKINGDKPKKELEGTNLFENKPRNITAITQFRTNTTKKRTIQNQEVNVLEHLKSIGYIWGGQKKKWDQTLK